MIITPVDNKFDLFSVVDLYPTTILENIAQTDHLQSEWKREDWQAEWPRKRLINTPGSIYEAIDLYVKSKVSEPHHQHHTFLHYQALYHRSYLQQDIDQS